MVKLPATDEIRLSSKCFKKMKNLKIFININAWFCGKIDYLPEQLRILDWHRYPLQSLPSNFNMKKLVHLNMPCSRISHVVEGFKRMENLKSMNFSECEFLTEIPNLSGCPNLERMNLRWCTSLVEIHPSVGFLEKLVDLDLGDCISLVKLPTEVNWRSLRHLDLGSCRGVKSFHETEGEMEYLPNLFLWELQLSQLQLQSEKLKRVELYKCLKLLAYLSKVISAVLMATGSEKDREFNMRLNEYKVHRCNSLSDSDLTDFLETLDCASTLKSLDLSGSNIVSFSQGLGKFIHLQELDLGCCWNLVEIPQLPPFIKHLDVRDCVSLEKISKLSKILEREESQMIEEMNLTNCWRLIKELVKEANVDYEAAEALFSLFLCSQQS